MADGVFEGLFRKNGPVKRPKTRGCAPKAVPVLLVLFAIGTAALVVVGHLAMTA